MRRFALLLPLLLAAACKEAPKPDWAKENAPGAALPQEVCAKVRKVLDAMRNAGGADYTDQGEATLPAQAWTAMQPQQRDQFANTLAYHASCVAGATSDAQSVLVRSVDGEELMRRSVSTRVSTSDLLGGE